MRFCEEHQKHFIDDRGCVRCIGSSRENEDYFLFHSRLQVSTHFIVDLAFEQNPRAIQTLRALREVITDVIRLQEPDTLHATLTTGAAPLNPNDKATVSVVESSSKTGATFPVVPANLQFSVDNTGVASITPNPDGTATLTAIADGTATLTVTDTANGLSNTVGITVSSVVVPDQPDTLTITLTPIVPVAVAAATATGAKLVN